MVNSNMPKVGVVLNAFKRTEFINIQLDALDNQSIKPSEVYVWQNDGDEIPSGNEHRYILAKCSSNLGVWARFAFALNLDCDYICLLDDDTIPGERWFENCINTLEIVDGLLGTRGLRFLSNRKYTPYEDVGWKSPNNEIEKVDIVGHSWFFKRELLGMFWSELPDLEWNKRAGEDIHFSYMIQKFGLHTYVPPHPKGDLTLWGSNPKYGKELGNNEVAISVSPGATQKFDIVFQKYIAKGFKLTLGLNERLSKGIVLGTDVVNNNKLRKIIEQSSILKRVAKYVVLKLKALNIHI